MKIIAGVHAELSRARCASTAGEVHFRSARDALAAGIGMVHQELSDRARPDGRRERVPRQAADQPRRHRPLAAHGARGRRASRSGSASTSIPTSRLGDLPIGLQQLIELARVLFSGARIIILDEPTSALSPPEIERLFAVLRRLARRGHQHRLHLALPRRHAARLRHGDDVPQRPEDRRRRAAAEIDKRWLIERMIGGGREELEESYTGEITLPTAGRRAGRARTRAGCRWPRAFRDVSLEVRAGEVLGIYGFMGCGQLELARDAVRQAEARPRARSRSTASRAASRSTAGAGAPASPSCRRAAARCCSTQEPVYKNISISILDRIAPLLLQAGARARRSPRGMSSSCGSGPPRSSPMLGKLSGGNQQKVALAKWLTYPPQVLVLSEPTRGMDVGAKDDVVQIVRGLRDAGARRRRGLDRAGDGAVAGRPRSW